MEILNAGTPEHRAWKDRFIEKKGCQHDYLYGFISVTSSITG